MVDVMNSINEVRPYAEIAYFIAGVGLLIVAGFGLRQLGLLKEDIRTRNLRAAREKAIEAANQYVREFIPSYNRFWHKTRKAGLSSYDGPVSDFTRKSVEERLLKNAVKRLELTMSTNAFNFLETVAAHFTTGVADENIGFRIIGRSYCGAVGSNYDIISLCRPEKACPLCDNIVQLYRTWSARLSKEELKAARTELDKNISSIAEGPLEHIQPEI
jgi:hypothetical protein